jgi:hypothetical protein
LIMVRRTDVTRALEGLLYDMENWQNNGYSSQERYIMTYKRIGNLLHQIKYEQKQNRARTKKSASSRV